MDGTRSQAGFSLVEMLIAAVLLLVIALGIIPLFIRSVTNNQEGRFTSVASAVGASEIERLNNAPFNGPDLTVPAGQVELIVEEWQPEANGPWIEDSEWTDGDGFAFHRIIRVRQFGLIALGDGKLEKSEAIDGTIGAANPGLVQIKEIVLQVESGNFPGADQKEVTLRSVRSI